MLNPEIFSAVFNAHGLYNSEQFVLRLSPKNHALLEKVTLGDFDPSNVEDEIIQAYSTYIHETIHWWQHMGSTTGLVLSMCYPLQLHSNFEHLQTWCSTVEVSKPIKKAATEGEFSGITHGDTKQASANVIVHNTMDLQFFRTWLLDPNQSLSIYEDPHFLSAGHCFRIVYSDLIYHISALIDPSKEVLPNAENWVEHFDQMVRDKVTGYYRGSPIMRRPVGVREIFEGQACFCQMQFLANCGVIGGELAEFKKAGMLHGIYEQAFEEYLKITKMVPPESVNDPKVGLFLLVCDLAINPMEGLLFDISDFPNFVNDADPGLRFLILCKVVAEHLEDLDDYIDDYSKEEYITLSSFLSEAAGFVPPSAGWQAILRLMNEGSDLSRLMEQHEKFIYDNDNMVFRVMLSHFVSFTLDKCEHPHIFCWPGIWKANTKGDDSVVALWLRNLALFSDQEHDDGIFIRQKPGVSAKDLERTINGFFASIVISDLARQWVLNEGEFTFNFKWLSQNRDPDQWSRMADEAFQKMFGVSIANIKTSQLAS